MPDIATVHHDVALTNVSVAFRNLAFIAGLIAPEVPVRKQSDRYFIYDAARSSLKERGDLRAPGVPAEEVDFALSSDSYYCDGHALATVIPDEERENADAPLQPDIDRTEYLTERLLLNQELALSRLLRSEESGVGYGGDDESTKWDAEDFDPVTRIEAARVAIIESAQVLPNTLVLSQPVYTAIRNAAAITNRVKYSRLGVVGTEDLAALFDVERVLVGRAVHLRPTEEGPVQEFVWGKDALLLHVPARPSLKSVSAVLTFTWAMAMGSLRGWSVDTWREERRKATAIRVQKYYDQKIVAPGAAYWFSGAVD